MEIAFTFGARLIMKGKFLNASLQNVQNSLIKISHMKD